MIEYARYINETTIDTNVPTEGIIDGKYIVGISSPEQLKKLNYYPLSYDKKPVGVEYTIYYEQSEEFIIVHYKSVEFDTEFPSVIELGEFPSKI